MPSQIILGKYELIRKLAVGGMAEVFLARVVGAKTEKQVVLKRILPHLAQDLVFVEMFLSEARLTAQFDHPNLVRIFDFGQEQGVYLMAMEFIDGPTLRWLARHARDAKRPLSPAAAAGIIAYACQGLAYAHDFEDALTGAPLNLVHRDIGPDNILLSRTGVVKVVDFGIAKATTGKGPRTQVGTIKGKLAYMPPEQMMGEAIDRRADIYSLGAVLFELVAGHRAFARETEPLTVQAMLYEPLPRLPAPDGLQEIVERAMHRDPTQRYPDCHALRADLERFIATQSGMITQYQLAQLVRDLGDSSSGPIAWAQKRPATNPPAASAPPPAVSAPSMARTELVAPIEPGQYAQQFTDGARTIARPSAPPAQVPPDRTAMLPPAPQFAATAMLPAAAPDRTTVLPAAPPAPPDRTTVLPAASPAATMMLPAAPPPKTTAPRPPPSGSSFASKSPNLGVKIVIGLSLAACAALGAVIYREVSRRATPHVLPPPPVQRAPAPVVEPRPEPPATGH